METSAPGTSTTAPESIDPAAAEAKQHLIEALCARHGIPESTIREARCKASSDTKRLLAKVLNHRYMAEVLVALKFQNDRNGSFSATKTVTLEGKEYTAGDVVTAFQWSVESYKHRCRWFRWAHQTANSCEWTGPIPTPNSGELYLMYKTWLGIKCFWGPSGPLEVGHYPNDSHPGISTEEVQAALALTQSLISSTKVRNALTVLLRSIPTT
jgi:hypothetical protein